MTPWPAWRRSVRLAVTTVADVEAGGVTADGDNSYGVSVTACAAAGVTDVDALLTGADAVTLLRQIRQGEPKTFRRTDT